MLIFCAAREEPEKLHLQGFWQNRLTVRRARPSLPAENVPAALIL